MCAAKRLGLRARYSLETGPFQKVTDIELQGPTLDLPQDLPTIDSH
jgi:hypothetical protein